jgi:hypothetical protein
VRDGDWKLIRVDQSSPALYDLSADIGEHKNLAEEMPEKTEDLLRQLKTWEQDKIQPIWDEAPKWTKVRYDDHSVKYTTGLLPGRKDGSRMLKN